jgi:MFS family permease
MDGPGQLTRFGALRVPAYRRYFSFTLLSMTADNVEHVISYWVMFQIFHSPAMSGFAVISHWLPFLLFSLHAGALADRYDCRRLIQLSQGLFMFASFAWGLLFLTGTLEMWHAVVLLLVHGFAGVLNAPALQLMIHDMVPAEHLPSAIRLNASSRQLAILLGPAVGGGLMLLFGPAWGLLVNVLIYVPLTVLLIRLPYDGHAELGPARVARRIGVIEGADAVAVARTDPRIMAMIALAGVTSFFVGNAFQAQMPEYALALGADPDGRWYSLLLAANAAGAIVGVILLETSHILRPGVRTAIACAVVWGITMGLFPVARTYGLAISLLVVAGMFNIAFTSMAQTVVQMLAPAATRGRIVGLFNTSLMGLRAGGGITVGLLGALIGVRMSLVLSSAIVVLLCGALLIWEARAEHQLTDELQAERLARASK